MIMIIHLQQLICINLCKRQSDATTLGKREQRLALSDMPIVECSNRASTVVKG